MANYSAADVKRLRDLTGAGMLDCKNALVEADGDVEAAVEALRIKGAKDVGKRAGRTAGNGLVISALDGDDGRACLSSSTARPTSSPRPTCSSRSPPTSRRPRSRPSVTDRLEVLAWPSATARPPTELIEEASASLKEKLELGRFTASAAVTSSSYLHKSDPGLPPTLGVLVDVDEAGAGDRHGRSAPDRRDAPAVRHQGRGAARTSSPTSGASPSSHPRGRQARAGDPEDRRRSAERLLQGCRADRAAPVRDPKKTVKQLVTEARRHRSRLCQIPDRAG